jgi:type IX secretion system PorP/SprF family membrane protein
MRVRTIIFFVMLSFRLFGQDPEFSQYYSAPLYLNPGFAGTASDHRFIANYRNQWPSITNGFVTYAFSYDYSLHDLNSGIGALLMVDKAGTAGLRSTQLNFQYAYKAHVANRWVISPGLNFGIGSRNVDMDKLVFYDQLNPDDPNNPNPSSPNYQNISSRMYFDFGFGGLAYSRKIWFGFSMSHLNKPNRSLKEEQSIIPVKTTLHGGIRIPLYNGLFKRDRVAAIAPSFVYKKQGNFDQFDIGTYFLYEPIVIGIWYRGIPITQNVADNLSQDAVVVILGFQLEKIEFSYSYDLTVSELGPSIGGAHEVALKYMLNTPRSEKNKKKEKVIPCPAFYRH